MKQHITIFYGGTDSEREVSLSTVKTVQANLDHDIYDVALVEVLPDATWQRDGQTVTESEILNWTDYAFIAMHGAYGEDGTLQKILDSYHVPYNGTGAMMSQIAFSKSATKDLFTHLGLTTPTYETHMLDNRDLSRLAEQIFQTFPQPCVIKPNRGGSSFGVSIVENKYQIEQALTEIAQLTDQVIIEQYITGCESTCGVIEHMRDQELYALPPVEIVPQNKFFDYQAKYHGEVDEICPATFDGALKEELQTIAKTVHRELGLSDYSRTDFMIHPKKGIYVLEVNTLPGLTPASLLPKELEAVGITLSEFFNHLIEHKFTSR